MRKHIPNTITLLNVACGVLAVIFAANNWLLLASAFIFLSAILDFLDGFTARLLKAYSALGKQLDSLADLISFGMAPAMIVYKIMDASAYQWMVGDYNIMPYVAILIPVFSTLRLAKFNIDDSQKEVFKGLPVPANAIFFASLPFILMAEKPIAWLFPLIENAFFLSILVIVFSAMLIMSFQLFSLKIKHLKWKGNKARYIFVAISIALLFAWQLQAIPLIILVYIFVSIFLRKLDIK